MKPKTGEILIRIIKFHPDHLFGLSPVEGPLGADWRRLAGAYQKHGPAFSLVHQGRILACGGVVLTAGDEGWAWSAVSNEAARRPLAVTRAFLFGLERMEAAGFRRVWALVRKGDGRAERWAGILGFRPVRSPADASAGDPEFTVYQRRRP